jgi:hypothetical protein
MEAARSLDFVDRAMRGERLRLKSPDPTAWFPPSFWL